MKVPNTKVADLPRVQLEAMAEAGAQVLECYRVLMKTDANIVGEVLREPDEFFEWDHYPEGDVYDFETHSQYYYHAHPPEGRRRARPFSHLPAPKGHARRGQAGRFAGLRKTEERQ